MKTILRHYGPVAALLAGILVVVTLLSLFVGGGRADDPRPQVVVTSYPLYLAAQNILGDTDGVRLTMLSGVGAGCLHDYQLSPADRRAVQEADLILMNGVGAESFLDGIVDAEKCVDTSAGLDLLCSDHDHAEGDHHHKEKYNEHVWLSPARYAKQVYWVYLAIGSLGIGAGDVQLGDMVNFDDLAEEIGTDSVVKMFTYAGNCVDYSAQIHTIEEDVKNLKSTLQGTPCVLFHDSMTYLADDLGLDVKLTLSVEGESGLSAHDLGQVEALAAQYPDLLLFYDTQYALRYEGVAGTPVTIRTAVQEDWLTAMGENVKTLKNIVG